MSDQPAYSSEAHGQATSQPLGPLGAAARHELAALQKEWWWFLLLGIAQTISAFWAGRWSGFLLTIFIGLLYMVAGVFIISHPVESTIELTLMLAFLFVVCGVFRIVTALVLRFPHWGWPLLNGVIAVLLGVMIYKQWPSSGLWVIGIFIGIEMIFNGWAWVMFSLGLRSLPNEPE